MEVKRDLQGEKEAYLERLAICIEDGGLSEEEAYRVAEAQLWATIYGKWN